MELAAAVGLVVEAVAPVNTQQTNHREEHTHTYTGAALDLERVEFSDIAPAVTTFQEEQGINGTLRLQDHRVTEFYRKLVVDVTGVTYVVLAVGSNFLGRKGIVFVTTQGDCVQPPPSSEYFLPSACRGCPAPRKAGYLPGPGKGAQKRLHYSARPVPEQNWIRFRSQQPACVSS